MASVLRPVEPYLPRGLRGKYLQHERPLLQHPGASADIDWMPNFEKYTKRVQARALLKGLPSAVPESWPQHLESPLSWTPSTVPAESEYIYELNESQKQEIIDAVNHFKGLGLKTRDISTDNFPLPSLTSELEAVAENVHNGFGFVIIRGFHSVGLSRSDETIAFLGISSYIAFQRGRQNRSGDKIVHILDVNNDKVPQEMRESVYTNVSQPFHSDVFCDVLALQTRSIASKGGNSIIASSWTVYNELASTRPDLIHVLAADNWTFDTYGRDPPYHQRPLLFCEEGKVFLNFSRRLLTGSEKQPRTSGIPPVTEAQAEALDAVHFTALKNQVVIPMQQGDMRFLNNHAILHSRDSFEDSDQWKRHLVRLWLRNPAKAWALPKGLEMAHDRVYEEWNDIDEDDLNWPLDAAIEEKTLLRGQGSCGQG